MRHAVCGSDQRRVLTWQWLASRPSRAGADGRSGKYAQPSQALPQRRTDGLAAQRGGRQRPNINGVIDCNDLSATVRYDDTINAQSIIKRFQQIEPQNPEAVRIRVICDNARYYHARLVKDYLANSRIELVFLPPYAPNLNLIERFWKFLKKTILYGRYYETFCQFKQRAAISLPD